MTRHYGNHGPAQALSRLRTLGCSIVLAAVVIVSGCGGALPRAALPTDGNPPLFTFVFDDGDDTDYLVARDIFADQGAVACSAITTDWINKPGFLSNEQILGLRDAGWEILGHTATHPNLRSLAPEQVEDELVRSKAALAAMGLTVNNLVYPYNKSNETVRRIARKHYRTARGGGNEFNIGIHDPYDLRSFSNKRDLDYMVKHIDHAYRERLWLIIYHHEIDAKITLTEKHGEFISGEQLNFTPSGAIGRHIRGSWFLFSGSAHIVPLKGEPGRGDLVTGAVSGAVARMGKVVYNERTLISDMLRYIRTHYPEMRIVTIDQGLDILGAPKIQ